MKVILKQDIKGVGKKNEVINASDGYARNFLFPKNLAVEANAENMSKLQAQKDATQFRKDTEKEDAKKIAENNNITRQGVRDLIKRAELKLFDYEEKLGFMEKKDNNEKYLNFAVEKIDDLEGKISDKEELQYLKDIKVQLKKINL